MLLTYLVYIALIGLVITNAIFFQLYINTSDRLQYCRDNIDDLTNIIKIKNAEIDQLKDNIKQITEY